MKAIQQIEEILGIKLEKKRYGRSYDPNQKNTYSIRREHIESLRLDNVVVDDFSILFPSLEKLRHLEINNSTIPNFSALLKRKYVDLRLNNVVFKNSDCDTTGNLPWHLIFSNMKLDAKCLRCLPKSNIVGFKQVEFKNCHIDNIQEIDHIDHISLLIFDKITYTHQPQSASKKATRRLEIHNTSFADVTFLPFSDSLQSITFENCQIGSIAGLAQFPKLDKITIDSDTTIEDTSTLENTSDKKITCIVKQGKQPLDLRRITPIKNYIDSLHLDDYKEKTIDFIEEFKHIKQLSFYESIVYIDALLPIAKQIETISFTKSIIKKHKYFGYFKNLTSFQTTNYDEDNKGLSSFKKILPLKHQLKVLEVYDHQKIHAAHLLKEFSALESLKIAYEVPVQTAEYILTLQNLKKLSLSIEEKAFTLSLENLKKLEFLILETEGNFTGFEHLKNLKSLKIGESISEPTIDVNALPKMESLQRLNLVSYDYEIKGLAQFPNLEALKLKGSPKVTLAKLEKLKVLSLENSSIEGFSTFEELPSLEKLDLSSIYSKLNLEGFHKFRNLKYLTFLESEVDDISHLEPLKKLEYLDLYYTRVSDVRVLNTLPNLKEVNLAVLTTDNLEKQLDKPEIAIYCGLPSINLWIWDEDEFGI
ncbi:MAG TPA: hypothetical protein DCS93_16780 [Microscillaceae bacterium]|nr:hypothetical protein [Microscillaceae bacterium]